MCALCDLLDNFGLRRGSLRVKWWPLLVVATFGVRCGRSDVVHHGASVPKGQSNPKIAEKLNFVKPFVGEKVDMKHGLIIAVILGIIWGL